MLSSVMGISSSPGCLTRLRSGDCRVHNKLYPAVSSYQKRVHCCLKGMDMVRNNTKVYNVCQGSIPHPITLMQAARPLIQTRMDPSFLFFTPNSDHAMQMLKQKSKQIRPGNIFKVSYAVQFW